MIYTDVGFLLLMGFLCRTAICGTADFTCRLELNLSSKEGSKSNETRRVASSFAHYCMLLFRLFAEDNCMYTVCSTNVCERTCSQLKPYSIPATLVAFVLAKHLTVEQLVLLKTTSLVPIRCLQLSRKEGTAKTGSLKADPSC